MSISRAKGLNRVRSLTHEEINWVTNWQMRTTEETYYKKNGAVPDIIDKRGFKLKEVNRIWRDKLTSPSAYMRMFW